jgi:hypothetical protein
MEPRNSLRGGGALTSILRKEAEIIGEGNKSGALFRGKSTGTRVDIVSYRRPISGGISLRAAKQSNGPVHRNTHGTCTPRDLRWAKHDVRAHHSCRLRDSLPRLLLLPTGESAYRAPGNAVCTRFHYLPLHLSDMGHKFGGEGDCPVTGAPVISQACHNNLPPVPSRRSDRAILDFAFKLAPGIDRPDVTIPRRDCADDRKHCRYRAAAYNEAEAFEDVRTTCCGGHGAAAFTFYRG